MIRHFIAGTQPSASHLNQLVDAVNLGTKIVGSEGVAVNHATGGSAISLQWGVIAERLGRGQQSESVTVVDKWIDVTGTGKVPLTTESVRGRVMFVRFMAYVGTPAESEETYWAIWPEANEWVVIRKVGTSLVAKNILSTWGGNTNLQIDGDIDTYPGRLVLDCSGFYDRHQVHVLALIGAAKTTPDLTI